MRASLFGKSVIVTGVVALIGGLGAAMPTAASAEPGQPAVAPQARAVTSRAAEARSSAVSRPALADGERYVCPAPSGPGQMECMSIIRPLPRGFAPAATAAANGDYGPAQLQSAYKLTSISATKGKGVTVAIVDSYQDPDAAADLSHYRSYFHLSACTIAGKCLRIVNQSGQTSPLPAKNASWAVEESLDLDMVSAICPNCHILLVEASGDSTVSLGTAEDTAIRLGARYVSNSWSSVEYFGQDSDDSYFDHPGVVQTFAAGDNGYAPAYPADLQTVTSVGGTTLKHASNSRGWTETVWGTATGGEGTAGGCSAFEPKPSWQLADDSYPDGCLNRTQNDVSADADPYTGALVYDTFDQSPAGFSEIGGTSEATPIVTAVYALAGTPEAGTYPAEYPYLHAKDLFDVTSGVDGVCETFRQYLCHGEKGYDGPTGLGTPDGTAAFTVGTTHLVTVLDPGVQDLASGSSVTLMITGLDTSHATALQWTATGLPGGLAIHAVSNSTDAEVTGTLPATPGTFDVTVTAKDGSVTGSTHFTIVNLPSLAAPNPPSGHVTLTSKTSLCLDGGTDASGQAVTVQACSAASAAGQDWQYVAIRQVADTGTLEIAGECLTVANTSAQKASLASCDGSYLQQWTDLGDGSFWSPGTGGCLTAAASAGSRVTGSDCTFGNSQTWNLPAGPLVVGGSLCLDNTTGTTVKIEACDYSDQPADSGQLWALEGSGEVRSSSGLCLASTSLLALTSLTLESCNANKMRQIWEPGPSGELQTIAENSAENDFNMCLADPASGGAGTTARQDQCYGYEGEIWGLN